LRDSALQTAPSRVGDSKLIFVEKPEIMLAQPSKHDYEIL
jgi:hypothetical protein